MNFELRQQCLSPTMWIVLIYSPSFAEKRRRCLPLSLVESLGDSGFSIVLVSDEIWVFTSSVSIALFFIKNLLIKNQLHFECFFYVSTDQPISYINSSDSPSNVTLEQSGQNKIFVHGAIKNSPSSGSVTFNLFI